jgi:hypothetical protein
MTFGPPTLGPNGEGFDATSRVRRATRLADKAIDVVSMPTFPGVGGNREMAQSSEFLGQSADYDLLEEPSVASTRFFSDLDTVDVTRLFFEGGNVGRESPSGPASYASSVDDEVQTSSVTAMDTDSLAVEALL